MKARSSIIHVALTVAMILGAGAAGADRLVLRDGDAFSGQLVEIADGTLTFITTLSGQMMVPTEEVQSLSTDAQFRVKREGKDEALARFMVRNGTTRIEDKHGAVSTAIDMAGVIQATPMPKRPALQGEWDTGVHWRSANDDYLDVFSRFGFERTTGESAFRGRLLLQRTDADSFPRWMWGDAEWRWAGLDQFHPLATMEFERDRDAAMSLRGALSLGIGRQLFEDPSHQLYGDVGVGGTTEYYDTDIAAPRTFRPRIRDEAQDLHLRLRLRYARNFFGSGTILEDFRAYPSLTGLGELRARSESSLLLPFAQRFKLRFDLLVDYETDPRLRGLDNWRTAVGASLLWDF